MIIKINARRIELSLLNLSNFFESIEEVTVCKLIIVHENVIFVMSLCTAIANLLL